MSLSACLQTDATHIKVLLLLCSYSISDTCGAMLLFSWRPSEEGDASCLLQMLDCTDDMNNLRRLNGHAGRKEEVQVSFPSLSSCLRTGPPLQR